MTTSATNSLTQRLNDLRQNLLAAHDPKDENRAKELAAAINGVLTDLCAGQHLDTNTDLARTCADILYAGAPPPVAREMAAHLEPETIYEFSEYCLRLIDRSATPDKTNISSIVHSLLDLVRHPGFLVQVYGQKPWENLLLDLIIKSNFNTARLFAQRQERYADKVLFRVLHPTSQNDYHWHKIDNDVRLYSRVLLAITGENNDEPGKIAFLMENSLQMVLLDLACLTSGIVNIMIPANSVGQHVAFILNQTKASVLLISDEKQLMKVKAIQAQLTHIKHVIMVQGNSTESWVTSLNKVLATTEQVSDDALDDACNRIDINDLATIMYTSGTTGEPKGIMFSHLNIVYKRFCRALALPKIGDQDRFLCYLPLYHTFGRWLEMMGSIFWGAEYAFMENPSIETMIENMQRVKPTVFISIPKKWHQLYDQVATRVDVQFDDSHEIRQKLDEVTGGALQWGLSAAGYLPPDIFRFFQKHGVELMSGFGMTEATGGITMTPPDEYHENSLGRALPGIEIKLGDDGELLIRGHYVMIGYYGDDAGESFTEDGWLPSGDIMEMDPNGHVRILDRKKDIYKNVRGETIAPQKIENYFRDFEFIKQVFLVGDHRPSNTLLIYPNHETENEILAAMDQEQQRDYFASAIVTVNKFLASYERIVDFRIIDLPFSLEAGELTPKGTYKRRVIETNFKETINSMYVKNFRAIECNGIEVHIPNWFLREKGSLSGGVSTSSEGLVVGNVPRPLMIGPHPTRSDWVRVGNYYYRNEKRYVDLQLLLRNPLYWLGNRALVEFTTEQILEWYRLDTPVAHFEFTEIVEPGQSETDFAQQLQRKIQANERSLHGVHLATALLHTHHVEDGQEALGYLTFMLKDKNSPYYSLILELLKQPGLSHHFEVQRSIFVTCLPHVKDRRFRAYLRPYLLANPELLDAPTIAAVVQHFHDDTLRAIEKQIRYFYQHAENREKWETHAVPALLDILAECGSRHPTQYKKIRRLLVHFMLNIDWPVLSQQAEQALIKLRKGFREWLGTNQTVAVDMETGDEYTWEDVIIFEEGTDDADRQRLLNAVTKTSVLREAIFLLTEKNLIHLANIPPGGVWISCIARTPIKTIYRVTVQTRYQGSYDISIHLNEGIPPDELISKIYWVILAGSPDARYQLVEEFGGYWSEYDLWTKEYVHEETVEKYLMRITRHKGETNTILLQHIWPFFVWNATAAYFAFFKFTDYKLELANPTPANIVIPPHDYQTGTRLVYITDAVAPDALPEFFIHIYQHFIQPTEDAYPFIKHFSIWNYVFSGVLEVEGDDSGIAFLKRLRDLTRDDSRFAQMGNFTEKLDEFIERVEHFGFMPRQLFFAKRRFHRWFALNSRASLQAQATTLNDLYTSYNLQEFEKKRPEIRTRFFLETVFADASGTVKEAVREIYMKQRAHELSAQESTAQLSLIQTQFDLSEKEKFFLTRLRYPHLKPTDEAEMITLEDSGKPTTDVVVQMEDYDGDLYSLRKPYNPREISRLYQLFLEANMKVRFKPDHHFLVAISNRGHIIGGLVYVYLDRVTVYMEKIVIASRFRRKGISEGLMNELFKRLKSEHIDYVTTGFFRPEYFYRFGFRIERKYAGLVKSLTE